MTRRIANDDASTPLQRLPCGCLAINMLPPMTPMTLQTRMQMWTTPWWCCPSQANVDGTRLGRAAPLSRLPMRYMPQRRHHPKENDGATECTPPCPTRQRPLPFEARDSPPCPSIVPSRTTQRGTFCCVACITPVRHCVPTHMCASSARTAGAWHPVALYFMKPPFRNHTWLGVQHASPIMDDNSVSLFPRATRLLRSMHTPPPFLCKTPCVIAKHLHARALTTNGRQVGHAATLAHCNPKLANASCRTHVARTSNTVVARTPSKSGRRGSGRLCLVPLAARRHQAAHCAENIRHGV